MARIRINPREYRQVLERIERLREADEIIEEELKDTAKHIRKLAKSRYNPHEAFREEGTKSDIGYRKAKGKDGKVSYLLHAGTNKNSKYFAWTEWGTRGISGFFSERRIQDAVYLLGASVARKLSLSFKGRRPPNNPLSPRPFFFNSVRDGVKDLSKRLGKRLMKKP